MFGRNKMFVGRALFLMILYVLYLLLGGCIYHSIECPEELVRRPSPTHLCSLHLGDSLSHAGLGDKAEHCELWSFYNSVFFAFTAITTIGYGRAAPQTQLGRGVLLAYSLFGIPINGIFIGAMGIFFRVKVSIGLFCKNIICLLQIYNIVIV